MAVDEARRPGREPHGEQGRRLGRRQDRHVRRAARRQAVQRHARRLAADATTRARRRREAGQGLQARRHVHAADRHSGQGRRAVHLRPQRRVPGMCTAVSCSRAGRERTTSQNASVSIDESSIKHIPGARVVRRDNFVGVVAPKEYGAIQAAAQLKVKWESDPKLPGAATSGRGGARPATRTPQPGPLTRDTGNVDAALAARRRWSRRPTVPLQRHADRPHCASPT